MKQMSKFWIGLLIGLLVGVGISAILLQISGSGCF